MNLDRQRTALQTLRDTCAALCFLAFGFAAVKLTLLADGEWPKIVVTTENLDRTVIETGAAMRNFELASRGLAEKENAQYSQVQEMTRQLNVISSNANASVVKLNVVLDRLAELVADSDARMGMLTGDADQALKQLQPTLGALDADLAGLQPILKSAAGLTADPSIPATMKNLQASSENLVKITDNTAVITDDAAKTATFYYKRLTAPTTAAVKVGEAVAHYGTLFFGAFLGAR